MKLYATVTSERASKGQGGNKFIVIDFTVGTAQQPQKIGQVELYYNDDRKDGFDTDEWVLSFRKSEQDEWDIVAQGNVLPKGEKQKGENEGDCYMDVFGKKCLTWNHKH